MKKRPVVHIEIPASNRQTSAKFYKDLFGWEYEDMPGPTPYTTFAAGNTAGGYPQIDSKMYKPGDVIVYIESENLDADMKQIEAHGGKVTSPATEVPEYGWFVFFNDPAGNRLALWKPNGQM